MNTRKKKLPPIAIAFIEMGTFIVGMFLAFFLGFHLVTTPSVQVGIYQKTNDPIDYGTYVVICLPEKAAAIAKERGYIGWGLCPGWLQPVIKQVRAKPRDILRITEDGVIVNGVPLQNTRVLSHDSKG